MRRAVFTFILLLSLVLQPTLLAQGTPHSLKLVYDVRIRGNTVAEKYMLTVELRNGHVSSAKLEPSNPVIENAVLSPSPQHFYLSSNELSALALEGTLSTSYGVIVLDRVDVEPLGSRWMVEEYVCTLNFNEGSKAVVYDSATGILVYEGFSASGVGNVRIRLTLASAEENLGLVSNPESPLASTIVSLIVVVVLGGSLYTVAYRHRYQVY